MRASDYAYFDVPFVALAHRGGSLLPGNVGIENSLRAMRNAVALGFTHVETDVHVTKDGALVAFHDEALDRVTDGTGLIRDHRLDEVRSHLIGEREPIPTMDEIFEELPETRFNIDIKHPSALDATVDCIRRHHAQRRVNVGSFHPQTIRSFRREMGVEVPTAAGPIGTAWHALIPGLTRLRATPAVVFQVPVSWPVRGMTVPIVTPKLLAEAHARGKQVHVWTINDRQEMERLIDLGVDGLVTDRPDVLREVLIDRGLWH